MKFNERIKELRQQHKVEQKKLAEILETTARNIRFYEAGRNEPSIDKLITLADYFDVSVDYLLGRTDNPKVNK